MDVQRVYARCQELARWYTSHASDYRDRMIDVQDLAQDAFLAVWKRNLGDIDPELLSTIIRNAIKDALRRSFGYTQASGKTAWQGVSMPLNLSHDPTPEWVDQILANQILEEIPIKDWELLKAGGGTGKPGWYRSRLARRRVALLKRLRERWDG